MASGGSASILLAVVCILADDIQPLARSAILFPRVQIRNAADFMLSYLWVGIGGAIGSMLRFWLSGLVAGTRIGEVFPLGTMVINITGSFIIGIFGAMAGSEGRISPHWRVFITQLVMVGVCGGYTTFSSFSLQTLNLARDGEWLYAGLNVILSIVLCIAGVWLGYALGDSFNR